MEKKRLDCLIYEQGLAESREKAKIAVMMGNVYVDGQKQDKPGTMLPQSAKIEVRGETLKYVSRGGLKLEKALQVFPIDLNGKVTMDIGASTGGFTDCMLQNGAARVYSIDVGYGQLAWKLRTDPRVVNLERTNVRYLAAEQVPEPVDFFSVDVAFISLKLVLPVARNFLRDGGEAVCLIKPQFEAGREKVGKKGVVRDKAVHIEVIESITAFALSNGFSILGLTFSPVKGPEGNIEYLMYLKKSEEQSGNLPDIAALVEESHRVLNEGKAL
jgi:23S rRNA (cytidine1920-2'-O)/16S rRNA (cytidine1409-2'-O)-methyltransferase